jgi:aminotransferase in exopolysaccharide biosynthesis
MFNEVVAYIKSLYGNADFVSLHEPRFIGNEKKYVNECIDSTFVSSVGKFVDKFEEMVALFTGAKRAVVCVNGTNALHLALKLSGVEQNDEVITQPLTFIATCNAVSYLGAHPVFIDVDLDTMGLSPTKLKNWLISNASIRSGVCINKSTGRRIKCCVPMHTFGHPARIDEIIDICSEFCIEVVEDAAESLGSYYKGRHTGTFAKIGVLSFNGNKTITTGGGGMLLFDNEGLASSAKHLTTQAKIAHRWEFVHDQIGYNYRMPNINAALGCAQLENLDYFLEKKREVALSYAKFFTRIGLKFFTEPHQAKSNYWLNALILNNREDRDTFLYVTNDNGVMTRPIWRLMNKLPIFRDCIHGDLGNAEWLEDRVVNIPSSVVR